MFVNVNTFQMNYITKKEKIFFKHIFSDTEVYLPQMRDDFIVQVKS